ncbi:MAG: phosphonate ABC transporter substrate-binding protein [Cyanobium sp. NAT70]|nr:phosphonate ABC transporter substrate-binding protein [Cyanobium sp. NAT70]|tara:strand:- start:2491 stop:3420 length:930 start_codon:yes stop_codon:yes gene_type:complete
MICRINSSIPCLAGVLITGMMLVGCGSSTDDQVSVCGPQGNLRVGFVGSVEGKSEISESLIADDELERMRTLLTIASRCEVQFEPVFSSERARERLVRGEWDIAFLPPGLTAMAMQRGVEDQPIRQLVRPNRSRSALLVHRDSAVKTLADLNGKRLGLLPRGSLTGFYLPLYNLHGLTLKEVRYANNFEELLTLLKNGDLDVIAWDTGLSEPGDAYRLLAEDNHDIPHGSMVLSKEILKRNYKPMLKVLDDSAGQMPKSLGYSSGTLPAVDAYYSLKEIVRHVESWTLPLNRQRYVVFGVKDRSNGGSP